MMVMTQTINAQESAPQMLTGSAEQVSFSDEMLESAAKAYMQIVEINQSFQMSLQQTDDQEKRQNLQQNANKQFVEAIENSGLEVDQYNNIMQNVAANEELNVRFGGILQKLM
ncbi:hypothetical protein CHISP_0799 [Chitinispirillum alkaliphilum]|nr:hypothetical protein CHISP_0799 [Chitinispirillum alkaliphilum]